MRRLWLLPLAAAWLLAAPAGARGQQRCDFTGTQEASFVGGVGHLRVARLSCQDMRIRSDSAILYQESGIYQLFGRVFIDTPDVQLRSRDAQYYPDRGMITAQGEVNLLRKQDSTSISNGEALVLFRAGTLGRTEDALTVEGGRPHAVMRPRPAESGSGGLDSVPAAEPDSVRASEPDSTAAEPYVIDADRIEIRGQSVLNARGNVELRRGDLNAAADTLDYLSETGQLRLLGDATLDVETYLLTGGLILVTMADEEIQDILARRGARLTGDIEIEGGFIRLELVEGELDGLTAGPDAEGEAAPPGTPTQVGAGPPVTLPTPGVLPSDSVAEPRRATAASEDLTITADRLTIDLAASLIERLEAWGSARLVTFSGDSLNTDETPDVARSDWIEGDTIDAIFALPDTAPAADSAAAPTVDSVSAPAVVAVPPTIDSAAASPDPEEEPDARARPRLQMLVARVNARALYRLPPADTTDAADPACSGPGRFAVHYVVGDSITISMKDNEVQDMNVVGQVRGQHLEPPACAPGQPADTTQPTDTTATSPAVPPPGAQPPPPPGAPPDPAAEAARRLRPEERPEATKGLPVRQSSLRPQPRHER